MRRTNYALRGALGFGLVPFAVIVLYAAAVLIWPRAGLEILIFILSPLIVLASGVVGGAILGYRPDVRRSSASAAGGFAIAFISTAMLIPAVIASSFVVLPSGGTGILRCVLTSAVGWGLAFGLGGAIGAWYLRPTAALAGGVGFGIGGLLGGLLVPALQVATDVTLIVDTFGRAFFRAHYHLLTLLGSFPFPVGVILACIIGGWFLGRTIDRIDGGCEILRMKGSHLRTVSIVGAMIGFLGLLYSVLYPLRFRLPGDAVTITNLWLGGADYQSLGTMVLTNTIIAAAIGFGVCAFSAVMVSRCFRAVFRNIWLIVAQISGAYALGYLITGMSSWSLFVKGVLPDVIMQLALFGVPALTLGAYAAGAAGKSLEMRATRALALTSLSCGAIMTVAALLLLAPRIGTRYETENAARVLAWLREHPGPKSSEVAYYGTITLGRDALRMGDMAGAKVDLLKAAQLPRAKDISYRGPETSLARSLLEKGERDTVVQYLGQFYAIWPKGKSYLDSWVATIKQGGIPDFRLPRDWDRGDGSSGGS